MVIYKTINLLNDKFYIGKDSNNNNNYLGSGKIIKKAIKLYGKENYKKEILEVCNSKDELNKREIFWINELNSTNRNIGYNIALGGNGQKFGTKLSEETKKKISYSQTLNGYIKKYGEKEGLLKKWKIST